MFKKIIPFIGIVLLMLISISAAKPQWRYKGHKKIQVITQDEGITPIRSFRQIKEALASTTSQSLVVFDVDDTLVIREDAILRPCGESIRAKIAKKVASNEMEELSSIALKESKETILDETLPEVLKDLKTRKVKAIALTAAPALPYGIIENMADYRLGVLQDLGINFADSFNENSIDFGKGSAYKDGILFSAKGEKGDLLASFLKKVQYQPDQVIFIDDNAAFLRSVGKALSEMGIPYRLYQMKAGDNWGSSLSKKVARRQLLNLKSNRTWLSDTEARR